MVNQLRGERAIKLGEETFNCKLNFDSLVRIENALDTPILKLAEKISNAELKIINTATTGKAYTVTTTATTTQTTTSTTASTTPTTSGY